MPPAALFTYSALSPVKELESQTQSLSVCDSQQNGEMEKNTQRCGRKNIVNGFGLITALSNKTGLMLRLPTIANEKPKATFVGFKLSVFTDRKLRDLKRAFHTGQIVQFKAYAITRQPNEKFIPCVYLASQVTPMRSESRKKLPDNFIRVAEEIWLTFKMKAVNHIFSQYIFELPELGGMEMLALEYLLQIFGKYNSKEITLKIIHLNMCNCQEDRIYKYWGTNSVVRHKFLQDRCHIFCIGDHKIGLVSYGEYEACTTVYQELRQHGGCMVISDLFEKYQHEWKNLSTGTTTLLGTSCEQFTKFLSNRPTLFNVFPSKRDVSLQAHLGFCNFKSFLENNFHGNLDGSPIYMQCSKRELRGKKNVAVLPLQVFS
ncbi:Sporulation inhibitor of replication protein SirA [Trichinella spiralis]|uniref:Sporulation inhibitor of replication protein SirA n=1 Tax=Trichinella spiralis TaxID=6334 RepID=A0ABR3K240_TRISP